MRNRWADAEGLPYPLGVSRGRDGSINFALYSKRATAVTLLVYGTDVTAPLLEHPLDPAHHKSGHVWHYRLDAKALPAARYYGYRVDGPRTFHPDKLLFDPYAHELHFAPELGRGALGKIECGSPAFDWGDDRGPRHEAGAIIYELHVDAFTRDPSSGVGADLAGTFAGIVAKIPYLRELGVNVVELMPVYQNDPQGGEYWGYMPMSYFSPNRAYAHGDAVDAFRTMVKALHAADIEVILDVVYNHTSEAGADGPIYSYKGIDNDTYYTMIGSPPRYADFAGTGNTVNAANHRTCALIVDSMRHWVREMHVDGFRFDLASVFTRNEDGSINLDDPPLFDAIAADPTFHGIRMIAEPWDAAGAYELGRSFPGASWFQWNGLFRDDLRRVVRGEHGLVGPLVQRLYGSDDLFPDDPAHAYHAYQSINFITCHDGFTLYDLVAYDHKHNAANGHDNHDGADENFSWNCGFEGDDGAPPEVLALRERQAKNFIALLLIANGTPMLRAGDEFLQTQHGNNNPYNQNNATSWLDWSRRERYAGYARFVQQMIAFRKAHPSLARSRFWRDDVRWFGPTGPVDFGPEGRGVGLYLRGASQGDDDLFVMINPTEHAVDFALVDDGWTRVVDTARPSPDDFAVPGVPIAATSYALGAHAVVVLDRPSGR